MVADFDLVLCSGNAIVLLGDYSLMWQTMCFTFESKVCCLHNVTFRRTNLILYNVVKCNRSLILSIGTFVAV